jgi:hypothetical protein
MNPNQTLKTTSADAQIAITPLYNLSLRKLRPFEIVRDTIEYHAKSAERCPAKKAITPTAPNFIAKTM